VRVAAALVIGQIVLVAIVGWVTLTRAGDRPAPGAPRVDQLAAPGLLAPAAPPSPEESRGKSPSVHHRAQTVDPSPAAAAKKPGADPAAPTPARAAGPALTPSPPGTSSGPLTLVPPVSWGAAQPTTAATTPPISPAVAPSPTASAPPAPVLAGRPCDQLGALTRADDGRMVRCLPDRHHQLRWKIV
jgi:hypothetical protein